MPDLRTLDRRGRQQRVRRPPRPDGRDLRADPPRTVGARALAPRPVPRPGERGREERPDARMRRLRRPVALRVVRDRLPRGDAAGQARDRHDVGGIPEIVAPRRDRPPRPSRTTRNALAEAMRSLAATARCGRGMGTAGLARFLARFTIDEFARRSERSTARDRPLARQPLRRTRRRPGDARGLASGVTFLKRPLGRPRSSASPDRSGARVPRTGAAIASGRGGRS